MTHLKVSGTFLPGEPVIEVDANTPDVTGARAPLAIEDGSVDDVPKVDVDLHMGEMSLGFSALP